MQLLMYEFLVYAADSQLSASELLDSFCSGKGMCNQLQAGFISYLRGQGVM